MNGPSRFLASLLTCAALLTACDDDDAPPMDAGCEPIPAFETGDADGHPDPLGAAAGEVRAGRLAADDLPADRTGLATWAAGDFVIANDRVALLIEDAGDSDLYDPFGGRPVGIARVEGGALVEAGDFNEVIFGFGGFLVETESVTVLADGSDGGPAVVRATGTLGRAEFAGDLLAVLVPGDFSGLPAALDYTMQPGSDAVDVHLEVAAPTPATVSTPMLLAAFFQHYRMPLWVENGGFDPPTGARRFIGFVDDVATSYAWIAPEGRELTTVVEMSGVLVLSTGRAHVPGCTVERLHLGTFVLGGPGLPGLQRGLASWRGETLRNVRGTVEEADGSPATDVRVHVRRADGTHFARLTPAEDGTFSVDVPNETVSFFAFREGMPLVGPVEVGAATDAVVLTMPEYRTLTVNATDAAGPATDDFIPARVQVVPAAGAPVIPTDLGERTYGRGRSHVAFTTTGNVELRVPPGVHEVIVSRGYEYEVVRQTVDVTETESATVHAELTRSVDTTGVMCADYHIHTHRSPDSPDSPALKLTGLIADGLEIAVRSDHEWVNDFQPVIEEMGLESYAFGIGGEELTTFVWGHFGVFPLDEDRSQPNAGAVRWVGRLPPDVFDEVRARPEKPALIINHPRGINIGSYFSAAGFNPETGAVARPDLWDDEFTLVEVFNDADFEESADVVADWFALLNSGRRVYAVGSSDSHGIFSSPVGYPRTCLELGSDDPADRENVNAESVRDATVAGHSTISGGLFLTVTGPGGVGPGDEARGVGESAMFDVTLQAPCWITSAMELEVIVDGATVETIPIAATTPESCDPLRLEATGDMGISVPVAAAGSWVVFHAKAEMDLSPVHPGRMPFAVSNPVFLQR